MHKGEGELPDRADRGNPPVIDRQTIHVADALAEADEYPELRKNALREGWRTVLAVPLVHAGEGIGVMPIRRAEVHPFTERQIERWPSAVLGLLSACACSPARLRTDVYSQWR
jgi:hypothetical protein